MDTISASLWPQGVRGVLSHETPLSIMEISDVSPARIHVTIPPGHRIRRARPPGPVLHWAALPEEGIGFVEGVPVTKAARAIRDCAQAHLGAALLRQAIDHGLRHGWLAAEEAEEINSELFRGLGLGGRLGTSPLSPGVFESSGPDIIFQYV